MNIEILAYFFFLEKFPKVLIYANFKFQFLRDGLGDGFEIFFGESKKLLILLGQKAVIMMDSISFAKN
jgi:hypothetical protein